MFRHGCYRAAASGRQLDDACRCRADRAWRRRRGGVFAVGAALATYEWRRSTERQSDTKPSDSRYQSTTNTDCHHLCCHFRCYLRDYRIDADGVWSDRCSGPGRSRRRTDIDPFVINIAQGGVPGLSATVLSEPLHLIAASSNNIAKAVLCSQFRRLLNSHIVRP